MNEDKARFLEWLDRFARVPAHLRRTIEVFQFSERELLVLKPQIEAKYKLKAKYTQGRSRGA